MLSKNVRTYLDPDAVGPLPRSVMADDSDALAAARTIVRPPDCTQELQSDDVIEVFDPLRPRTSTVPVAYETIQWILPRRRLAPFVVGVVALACGLILAATARSLGSSRARAPAASPAAAAPPTEVASPAHAPATVDPASSVGVLRVDPGADGQHLTVDGVPQAVPAAVVRCGPHEVAVGGAGRSRTIDVPCGGEVTVYR
jgi:hypothetical protein